MRIDWECGSASINGRPIELDSQNQIAPPLKGLFSSGTRTLSGKTRFRSVKEGNYLGFATDVSVDVEGKRIEAIALLFRRIEFFEASILESKIVQAVQQDSGRDWVSDHPAKANLQWPLGAAPNSRMTLSRVIYHCF
jgi:hypothetical protein